MRMYALLLTGLFALGLIGITGCGHGENKRAHSNDNKADKDAEKKEIKEIVVKKSNESPKNKEEKKMRASGSCHSNGGGEDEEKANAGGSCH